MSLLETQAREMFEQGSDLRQFADAKVVALRAEFANSVENEANVRKALALGNQRLSEQTNGLRGSLQNAEQVHFQLQSEYAICRDALNHTMAQLSTQQPQAYADLETQKELLVETQRSWKNCSE